MSLRFLICKTEIMNTCLTGLMSQLEWITSVKCLVRDLTQSTGTQLNVPILVIIVLL